MSRSVMAWLGAIGLVACASKEDPQAEMGRAIDGLAEQGRKIAAAMTTPDLYALPPLAEACRGKLDQAHDSIAYYYAGAPDLSIGDLSRPELTGHYRGSTISVELTQDRKYWLLETAGVRALAVGVTRVAQQPMEKAGGRLFTGGTAVVHVRVVDRATGNLLCEGHHAARLLSVPGTISHAFANLAARAPFEELCRVAYCSDRRDVTSGLKPMPPVAPPSTGEVEDRAADDSPACTTTAECASMCDARSASEGAGCYGLGLRYAKPDEPGAHREVPRDLPRAQALFLTACDRGVTRACHAAAELLRQASPPDPARAARLDAKACKLGLEAACGAPPT